MNKNEGGKPYVVDLKSISRSSQLCTSRTDPSSCPFIPNPDSVKMQKCTPAYAYVRYVIVKCKASKENLLRPGLANLHVELPAVKHVAIFIRRCLYNSAHAVAAPLVRDIEWVFPVLLSLLVFVHFVIVVLYSALHMLIH